MHPNLGQPRSKVALAVAQGKGCWAKLERSIPYHRLRNAILEQELTEEMLHARTTRGEPPSASAQGGATLLSLPVVLSAAP